MYSVRITNNREQTLTLTENESKYQIMEITGLSSPGASVNTTAIYGMAGGVFNSSHVENRAITITLKVLNRFFFIILTSVRIGSALPLGSLSVCCVDCSA